MSSQITIVRYEPAQQSIWNDFVRDSRNGTFLFHRDYMDYHAERFPDYSLMFYDEEGELIALLPATLVGKTLSSHGGLTYGGVVHGPSMKAALMLGLFSALKTFLRAAGIESLSYKTTPHIFHRIPSEEDLYALFRNNAALVRRDLSSAIFLKDRLAFSKGRRYALKQAQKIGLSVTRSYDFDSFMKLKSETLESKYGVSPTHTAAEIDLLAQRFPDQIKLFTTHHLDQLVAGVLVYEHQTAVHTQYIAANDVGKKLGALDLIIDSLVDTYIVNKNYFDFGISTEDAGQYLNEGLVQNKEWFGARTIVHDFYELQISE
jgi:hypothetical protein